MLYNRVKTTKLLEIKEFLLYQYLSFYGGGEGSRTPVRRHGPKSISERSDRFNLRLLHLPITGYAVG